MFVVTSDLPGFHRGRKLDKVGQAESDTAELFFDDVRVPVENVLGEIDRGFAHVMERLPQERIGAAVTDIAHAAGELTAVDAAKAKWWTAQAQSEVLDACVQLHGGYGYMREYRVARAWRDARVTKIWAGSNEIMKELIGRDLGL
nr:acyl-CoA dehydrogenase family protein [Streptomyces vietnamensis]